MVTTIILSKDRPAQLDLLLRSIERNGAGWFDWEALWNGERGDEDYDFTLWHPDRFCRDDTANGDFEWFVRAMLAEAGEFVCFLCDDDILYRPAPVFSGIRSEETLCWSLRLGLNTVRQYPSDLPQAWPWRSPDGPFVWDWRTADLDFGYPGSVDGHIFRTADVRRMLAGRSFPNPTSLECALVEGCNEIAEERPLMACYPHSVLVGNPINRVSAQSNVRYGTRYPVTAAECQERFGRGERIDLDALDFSEVNGAHSEIQLVWK